MAMRRLHFGAWWLTLLTAGRSMNRPRSRFILLASFAAVLGVSACGDDKAAKAEAAAKWLSEYSREHPLPHGWRVLDIRTSKNSDVVAEVVVPISEMEADIRSRDRMQQIEILQLACPPRDAEIWRILEKRQTLWVNLVGSHEDGITKGACKKPKMVRS